MRLLPAFLLLAAAACAQPAPFSQRFEEIKASASKEELYRFLWALPKGGDLHNHHEYSVPPEAWLELATDPRFLRGNAYYTRVRMSDCGAADTDRILYLTVRRSTFGKLPPCVQRDYAALTGLDRRQRAAWVSALKLDQPGEGREEFFERIVPRLGELEYDEGMMLELLVRQQRQAAAEGLRYVETQTDPLGFLAPDDTPVPVAEGVAHFRRRLAQPDSLATGVALRFQVAVLRFSVHVDRSLAQAYEFVHRNRDLWVGVNIVGREDNPDGKAARLLPIFRELRSRYSDIPLSLHGGESELPGREVRDTLLLGATRIGHGTNLISDPDTLLALRGGRTLIEISLVSNQMLGYTPDLRKHPFPEFLRLGIPVSLHRDDGGALDSNMTDEYFLAVTNFNLSWSEMVQIGRQSLEFSFAEAELKKRMLADYDRAVGAFERRYGQGDWRRLLAGVKAGHSGYSRRSLGL